MPSNRYPLIASEGWLYLVIVLVIGVYIYSFAGFMVSLPFWLLLVVLLYLFRDPRRDIPSDPLGILSPVHGEVTDIERVHDPLLDRDAIRVRIHMAFHDIYALHAPIEGKIMRHWSQSTDVPETSQNGSTRQHAFWIRTDEGDDLVLAVRKRQRFSMLRCYAHSGERVGQGQRCGYFYLGGIIDLYLPPDSRVTVRPHERLKAGSDSIGRLVHEESATAVETADFL